MTSISSTSRMLIKCHEFVIELLIYNIIIIFSNNMKIYKDNTLSIIP